MVIVVGILSVIMYNILTPRPRPSPVPSPTPITQTQQLDEAQQTGQTHRSAPTETKTATSTEPTTTPPAPTTHHLGDTVQFFLHDSAIFTDPKNSQQSFTVTAAEFTDSRCPQGVECIWAGELGVRLTVTPTASSTSEDVRLGMVRAKTADAFGLHFMLNDIVESEGGTNATVKIE
jgi:hypothetical protein